MAQIPLAQIHDVNFVKLDKVEMPVAGADDVLIKVAQCGICGSDLGYIAMGGLFGPGTPMPIGHELSGTVVQVGENVTQLKSGDRVVVNPEENSNRIGNSGAEGGFSPYLLVKGVAHAPQAVLTLPDGLDFEEGAMVEPLSVAMHAVHQGEVKAEDKVVIFGAGTIGLGIYCVLRYYGVSNIVVVDRSSFRLRLAEQLGASVFNASEGDLSRFLIHQQGANELMGMPIPGSDVYFEATGVGEVFNQTVNLSKVGARIVVVGVHKAPVSFDLINVLIRELKITGSMAYPSEFPKVIEMLQSGKVDAKALISHRFALSAFDDALVIARDAEQAIKVLIDCQA